MRCWQTHSLLAVLSMHMHPQCSQWPAGGLSYSLLPMPGAVVMDAFQSAKVAWDHVCLLAETRQGDLT